MTDLLKCICGGSPELDVSKMEKPNSETYKAAALSPEYYSATYWCPECQLRGKTSVNQFKRFAIEDAEIAWNRVMEPVEKLRKVAEAAKSLCADVQGAWSVGEHAIRQDLGNTNYEVVKHWLEETTNALAALALGEGE